MVELACGTGAVTRMILEKVRGAHKSVLIAIDQSASAIKEAREQLNSIRDVVLQFVHSRVEALREVVKDNVDRVIYCNGIHYVSDKEGLFQQIKSVLKGNGMFAFNTAFFQGCQPPETEQFYRRWMYRAVRYLKANYGMVPTGDKVEPRKRLSIEQYRQLLEKNGFKVLREDINVIPMTLEGWLAISQFQDFIEGAMPGVPLEPASEALQEGVKMAFQELGIDSVPRHWLEVVAVKA